MVYTITNFYSRECKKTVCSTLCKESDFTRSCSEDKCPSHGEFKLQGTRLRLYSLSRVVFILTDLGERDDISNPTKGILLVYGEGKWGTVCAEANVTTEIGEVICNSLQLGKFVRTQNYLDSDFAKDAEETITRSWLKAGIQPIDDNF